MSKILLINDMPSYGKVALAAMNPILGYQGHQVFSLPTALVSNTLDYGKFEILETTDYMQKTLEIWKALNFDFDCICTGFLVSQRQSEWISQLFSSSTAFKMVDPIMADDGHLYNGVGEETVEAMRELCAYADLIVPNLTEAEYLTGLYLAQKEISEAALKEIVDALHKRGARSVVVTSVKLDQDDRYCVAVSSEESGFCLIDYDCLPVRVPGTGDIFSSVLIGELLSKKTLKLSTVTAMRFVYEILNSHPSMEDVYRGVIVERYLSLLKRDIK